MFTNADLRSSAVPGGRTRSPRRGYSVAVLLLASLLGAAGCSGARRPSLIVAEFQDDVQADGAAVQGETILLTFSAPLPETLELGRLNARLDPPARWETVIERTDDPRVLLLRIVAGNPAIRLHGLHGRDAGSTGIGLDRGDGHVEWIDLQPRRSLPVLERVIWVDHPLPYGNLVVDQDDRLRLIFDRPVTLAADFEGRDVSEGIYLEDDDALYQGETPAVLEAGDEEHEVRIVLGSDPLLEVDPDRPGGPSTLSLRGTPILPFAGVRDRYTGEGAISRGRVEIALPDPYPIPRPRSDITFPDRATRVEHTVTPFLGWHALVAGGQRLPGYELLDEILLFDPFHERSGSTPFVRLDARLPHPTYQHSATRLAGPDGSRGTLDDVVVIAGGFDGERSLDELVVVAPDGGGGARVILLEERLRLPRRNHAACEGIPNQLVVDGGESREEPIECGEILTLQFAGDDVTVAQHQTYVSIARVEHTLTRIERPGGAPLLLAYGGYGRDRRPHRHPRPELGRLGSTPTSLQAELLHFRGAATVLVSPVLIDPVSPENSLALLDTPEALQASFDVALPRRLHAAASFLVDGSPLVVIAGGTTRHAKVGFAGPMTLWEMPLVLDRPDGDETRHAIVIRIDLAAPRESTFEVVRHPSLEPAERTNFASVVVPDYGLVLLGGEPATDRVPLHFADVFFPSSGHLHPLAVPLRTARTAHGAYYVEADGQRSIFVIGGQLEDGADPSVVEEIPLPPR